MFDRGGKALVVQQGCEATAIDTTYEIGSSLPEAYTKLVVSALLRAVVENFCPSRIHLVAEHDIMRCHIPARTRRDFEVPIGVAAPHQLSVCPGLGLNHVGRKIRLDREPDTAVIAVVGLRTVDHPLTVE